MCNKTYYRNDSCLGLRNEFTKNNQTAVLIKIIIYLKILSY